MTTVFSFSCTRSESTAVYDLQTEGFSDHHRFGIAQKSIFEAYDNFYKIMSKEAKDDDIIILCHDDIEIWDDVYTFTDLLINELDRVNTGFVGVAGTTYLPEDSVWWDARRRQQGLHRGFVFQGNNRKDFTPNYFGPSDQVVVLDGLFLAIKWKTWKTIFPNGIEKPALFEGCWDFYDIWMTAEAHKKGFINRTFPGIILHKSPGEIAGRDSWLKNREAFQKMFKGDFPLTT